jgi:uncharacterized protein (TIGR02145 family)
MKKILTSICVLTLSISVFAQQFNLGKVSFATEQTWTIGSQTWSDAVQAENCSNKTTFKGFSLNGEVRTYNIDCRSNPNHKGDLFSWRAVNELKNELCPYPWRVPTPQDFINLDIALGGNGSWQDDSDHRDKYFNVWGAVYGGSANPDGTLADFGLSANYWSQSEYSEECQCRCNPGGNKINTQGDEVTYWQFPGYFAADYGCCLLIESLGTVTPQSRSFKYFGQTLRCVRDKK